MPDSLKSALTVGQLIKELQQMDPALPVTIALEGTAIPGLVEGVCVGGVLDNGEFADPCESIDVPVQACIINGVDGFY